MAKATMKQWVTTQTGLDDLKQEEVPVPNPKEEEVLVKINTVSLNYRDTEGIDSLQAPQDVVG